MTENDPAKEWGLPDWRDADSYANFFGSPEQWSDDRWRWEFKRRQSGYRATFQVLVDRGLNGVRLLNAEKDRSGQRQVVFRQITEAAPNVDAHTLGFVFQADAETAVEHEMFWLPSPRFSDQPDSVLHFAESVQVAKLDSFGGKANVFSYQFDISKPLAPQLEACRKHLEFLASWKGLNVKRENRHKAKFFEYLRVLDANECGVKPADFASILEHKAQDFHGARDTLKAAERLRNKF